MDTLANVFGTYVPKIDLLTRARTVTEERDPAFEVDGPTYLSADDCSVCGAHISDPHDPTCVWADHPEEESVCSLCGGPTESGGRVETDSFRTTHARTGAESCPPAIPLVLSPDCLDTAHYLAGVGFDPSVALYLTLHTTTTAEGN
jgi:hypothetical protein